LEPPAVRRPPWIAAGVAVALVGAVLVTGLVTSIDPGRWDLAALGRVTYLIAGGFAFLEVGTPLGLITPSELAVPFAGAAAAAGAVGLMPLILVVWVCAVAGDSTGFLTGRLVGDRLLQRILRRPGLARRHAALTAHFARHGSLTVLVGRWLPYARTATPLLAGTSGMPYRRFVICSVVGSGVWAAAMCSLGFLAYRSVDEATQWLGRAGLVVLLLAIVTLLLVRRRARRPEDAAVN
jgi:membrane protein DedA with SNARE-associated domain